MASVQHGNSVMISFELCIVKSGTIRDAKTTEEVFHSDRDISLLGSILFLDTPPFVTRLEQFTYLLKNYVNKPHPLPSICKKERIIYEPTYLENCYE